jgi:hypothetical protein
LPLSKITVNGKDAKPKILQGDLWKAFIVPLDAPTNEIAWSVQVTARPKVPFAAKSFVMSTCASARRPIATKRVTVRLVESASPAAHLLPTPFAAQRADFMQIQPPREVQTAPAGGFARITQADLKTIKAARLHFGIFGVNEEEQYRNKPVTFNGVEIGILPTNNKHSVDQWEEKTIEIPKDKWGLIAANNVITVAGCGGDCFKIMDLALAVQLPDGTWAESNHDSNVYCGVGPGWLYFEGAPFTNNKSPDIKLALPVE